MVSPQRRQSLRRKSGLTALVSEYLGVSLTLTSSSAVNSRVPTTTSPSVSPLATLQHGRCKVVFNQLPTTPLSAPMAQLQLLLILISRSHPRPQLRLPSSLTKVTPWKTPKPRAPRKSPSRLSQPVARRTTPPSLRSPASRPRHVSVQHFQEHHSCMLPIIFGAHLVLGPPVLPYLDFFCSPLR